MNRPWRRMLFGVVIGASIILSEAAQAYEGGGGPASGGAVTTEVFLAYIDPGAAGFIVVSVLGFLAAIGYTARAYLSRIRRIGSRSRQTTREDEVSSDQLDA